MIDEHAASSHKHILYEHSKHKTLKVEPEENKSLRLSKCA